MNQWPCRESEKNRRENTATESRGLEIITDTIRFHFSSTVSSFCCTSKHSSTSQTTLSNLSTRPHHRASTLSCTLLPNTIMSLSTNLAFRSRPTTASSKALDNNTTAPSPQQQPPKALKPSAQETLDDLHGQIFSKSNLPSPQSPSTSISFTFLFLHNRTNLII
jgi:hypothetical protein